MKLIRSPLEAIELEVMFQGKVFKEIVATYGRTTVSTKHGPIKTDHILFIASGAFQLEAL